MKIPELTPKVLARFWSKVNKDGPIPPHRPELGPCWIWLGADHGNGYGDIRIAGRNYYPHRLSFLIHHGRIPDGKPHILHKCDNPICVRDSHLFPGTHQDNMADLFMKKRHSFGSNSNLSKLTEDDVLEIKRLLHEPVTQKEIADRFVITPGNVSAIANGKSWNLTGEKIQSALHSKIEPCGSKNGSAKLCESNIPEIRNLLAQGIPQRKIAEVFEISQRIICLINQGKLWRHV